MNVDNWVSGNWPWQSRAKLIEHIIALINQCTAPEYWMLWCRFETAAKWRGWKNKEVGVWLMWFKDNIARERRAAALVGDRRPGRPMSIRMDHAQTLSDLIDDAEAALRLYADDDHEGRQAAMAYRTKWGR